jgi:voltage-gated potassium channel Kch
MSHNSSDPVDHRLSPVGGLPTRSAPWWMTQLLRYWKASLSFVVLLVATISFTQVEISGGKQLRLIEALYNAIKLFVLDPEGTPERGATIWVFLLWLTYFFAPALTATVLIERLARMAKALRSPERVVRRFKGHIIVCALGKHATLILDHVLSRDPTYDVVIIDNSPGLPSFLDLSHRALVPVVRGEMSDPATLSRAGVERAKKVFAMSGGDVVNLNTCLAAKERNGLPGFQAIALVADISLSRGVAELARREGVVTLNPYEIAARNLVCEFLADANLAGAARRGMVIAGFGRFGQMFTKALLEKLDAAEPARLAILDRKASAKVAVYRSCTEEQKNWLLPIDGEIDDPRLLQLAFDRLHQAAEQRPTVILCTDDDANNLNTALLIREHWGTQTVVLTRLFNPPPRFRELTAGTAIRSFHLPELISRELPSECY